MNNINIKELRESKGVSQAELSRRSGIKAPNLHKYENGGRVPTIETMNKMLEAIGLHLKVTYELVEWGGEDLYTKEDVAKMLESMGIEAKESYFTRSDEE